MLTIADNNHKTQCVLIIDNGLLLSTGIERLLSDEVCLCVVDATSLDGATLLNIVKHLQPDRVILPENYFLTLSLNRLTILLGYPQLQVIIVGANDERVQVYYKQQIQITRLADLVHFIRSGNKNGNGLPYPQLFNYVWPKKLLEGDVTGESLAERLS